MASANGQIQGPPAAREACEARRTRLAALLGKRPALIAAGTARPRNYAANLYPYRASSHFLYLFGLPLRGAVAVYDGADFTLYLPEPQPDQALWEGAPATFDEIAAATGCPVRSLARLAASVRGRAVATLSAPDLETCLEQSRLLGREIRRGVIDVLDAPLADAMIELRLQHDAAALAELRLAAEATAQAHRAGMAATRSGRTAAAVRAAMESVFVARGMTCAYPSIVTPHGEVLHSGRYDHELHDGDLLLADVGAETTGGWAGDVTRTWPVSGRFSSTQRELYEVVLEAQRRAIAAVTPGTRYRNVHLLAAQALASGLVDLGILRGNPIELCADGVVALLFPHGIGHLLGLDVHDMEDLGDRAGYAPGRERAKEFGMRALRLDRDLLPGMAVTIEPGIYLAPAILDDPVLSRVAGDRLDRRRLAAFSDVRGIRIEDDILVTAQGREVLTEAIPKSVAAVEAAMAA
ncbi:MAG TPA: aminopeptidase P family protein [Polyangia bacterium]|nr:aminopeptidase P family protein [Polyangia bacterium]